MPLYGLSQGGSRWVLVQHQIKAILYYPISLCRIPLGTIFRHCHLAPSFSRLAVACTCLSEILASQDAYSKMVLFT